MASQSNTNTSHLCYSKHSWLEILEKHKCAEILQMVKPYLPHSKINTKTGNDWKAANSFLRLNKLSVSVFWDISGQHETSTVGLQDLMPSCRTQTPHNSLSDHWNRSAFSCYSRDRLFWPLWVPCQSCEWPVWVIYTSPRGVTVSCC